MRVERKLDWGGVASGVGWVFWAFLAGIGAQVFVVERGVCWVLDEVAGCSMSAVEGLGELGMAMCAWRRKGSYWCCQWVFLGSGLGILG